MVGSFRGRRARMGDGVSPGSTFPKRCANFGNERKKDWGCIGNVVTECEKEALNKVEQFLNNSLGKQAFDVSEIRDRMRSDVIEEFLNKGLKTPFQGLE
jgi:hypothetical protein